MFAVYRQESIEIHQVGDISNLFLYKNHCMYAESNDCTQKMCLTLLHSLLISNVKMICRQF